MYQIGALIIYGSTGVCRVERIASSGEIPALRCLQSDCKYYILRPLYQTGTIYTPVDQPKVFMRDVISKEKAEALITLMPSMQAQTSASCTTQELKECYEATMRAHECKDLLQFALSIYAKKQLLEQQNRKFGQVDERYRKWTEEMLRGEFSVALGIPRENVSSYIA
ncbi:MAG: CarD family transcriptional regulator, partial [Ruthenibacterium sp.]